MPTWLHSKLENYTFVLQIFTQTTCTPKRAECTSTTSLQQQSQSQKISLDFSFYIQHVFLWLLPSITMEYIAMTFNLINIIMILHSDCWSIKTGAMSSIIYSKLGGVPANSQLHHPNFLQSTLPTFKKIKPPTAQDFKGILTFCTHETAEKIQATMTEVSTTDQEVNCF